MLRWVHLRRQRQRTGQRESETGWWAQHGKRWGMEERKGGVGVAEMTEEGLKWQGHMSLQKPSGRHQMWDMVSRFQEWSQRRCQTPCSRLYLKGTGMDSKPPLTLRPQTKSWHPLKQLRSQWPFCYPESQPEGHLGLPESRTIKALFLLSQGSSTQRPWRLGLDTLMGRGLSFALLDVQRHSCPLPTRWHWATPTSSTVTTKHVSRCFQISPERQSAPTGGGQRGDKNHTAPSSCFTQNILDDGPRSRSLGLSEPHTLSLNNESHTTWGCSRLLSPLPGLPFLELNVSANGRLLWELFIEQEGVRRLRRGGVRISNRPAFEFSFCHLIAVWT